MIAVQMATKASDGSVSHDLAAKPRRDQRVVHDPLIVLEEPAEDQTREDERQRPGQKQAEPHRPLDLERLVGEQREAKPTTTAPGTVTTM